MEWGKEKIQKEAPFVGTWVPSEHLWTKACLPTTYGGSIEVMPRAPPPSGSGYTGFEGTCGQDHLGVGSPSLRET